MKEQPVILKGATNAITIILDENMEYDNLREIIIEKFKQTSGFYKDAQVAISFEGKVLTKEQQLDVLDIINEYTSIEVICILGKEEVDINLNNQNTTNIAYDLTPSATFHKGNLRSGQTLEIDNSVIVIGDINAGASITASGSIIILGSLRGNAFAGANGNRNSFVIALEMNPVQIRIADTIARAPDKPESKESKETKIAFLENDNIYIEPISKQILNDIQI